MERVTDSTSSSEALSAFTAPTARWFAESFGAPTAAQAGAWESISRGAHTLVVAPTGSGKTLAAFLSALDRLFAEEPEHKGTSVIYVSPLKALAVDVERNLRAPLAGIARTREIDGQSERRVTVGIRTGDTPPGERAKQRRNPPDILVTTPESLYLLLTSQSREGLASAHTVIVDEVHALAGTKRGAHLALSLERLDALAAEEGGAGKPSAQRIGLSATVAEPHTVAAFLAGERSVNVVAPPSSKRYDIAVRVPVDDLADLSGAPSPVEAPPGSAGQGSIWPHIERQVVDLITEHRSTLVFVNSRRLAERLSARINEIHAADTAPENLPDEPPRPPAQMMVPSEVTRGAPSDLAMAHHGSVSKERRAEVEHALKSGELRAVVATSSLELGIDMGAVDLVIQVESPGSVASGLQRVGRAGHNVGDTSVAVFYPKHRADLVHSAITVERMLAGAIEKTAPVANPLDVLAQHTIAAAAMDDLDVEEWFDLVRRTASFAGLPRAAYTATLDMLAGKYPSTDFAELRPRVVWDRDAGVLRGRPGAQRLAVTSGGTIADRGMFGVFMVGDNPNRVGELDEEMVYESRIGDVFALGATSWRIEEITHDRVLVSPAPAHSGRLPFWRGDEMGRPIELGRALGAFLRDIATGSTQVEKRLRSAGLDERARENLRRFVAEQVEATSVVPSDKTIIVERFRDEVGDWRVVIHSPFGAGVHWPWAEAIRVRLASRHGFDAVPVVHDDGIILRVPDVGGADDGAVPDLDAPLDSLRADSWASGAGQPPVGASEIVFDPLEAVDIVTSHVADTALFASKFRECSARAMLLPRLDPGKRAPLWQQRQKSSQLLDVAKQYPDFPIILEAVRECLQDVYDVPALEEVLGSIASGEIRVSEVTTSTASPFAAALMFDYMGAFVYEGDGPLAERKAAALSLDPSLLGQLLGRIELRELLDPAILEQVEDRLQHRAAGYKARDTEAIADLLRLLGPLTSDELGARAEDPEAVDHNLEQLARSARAAEVSFAGETWWVASEDLGRLRDGIGVPPPPGTAATFLESGEDPLGELVRRYARTHAPFTAAAIAERFGIGLSVARGVLDRLTGNDQLVAGEFRPGGTGTEWCDPEVLRRIRKRSLAELRAAIEPVEPAALGRFLPAWQGLGHNNQEHGVDGLLAVIEQLDGTPLPLSAWEPLVLAPRVRDYEPGMLDELLAAGEVLWCGRGRSGSRDGLVSLHPADSAPLTLPASDLTAARADLGPLQRIVLDVLEHGGGQFFRDIVAATKAETDRRSEPDTADDGDAIPAVSEIAVRDALWELAWLGLARGDTFAPLRSVLAGALPAPGNAGKSSGSGSPAHRSTSRGRGSRSSRAPRLGRARLGSVALAGGSTAGVGGTIGTGMRTPPVVAGRWSATPSTEPDATVRAHAAAELVLARHGVVTRGAVESEGISGGFAGVYKVLAAMEDAGGPRRGYYIEGLGASQFADGATIDRLRGYEATADETTWSRGQDTPEVHVLAATDPANPYGAALPWPAPPGEGGRAGRKSGALVGLVDGELALYLERGGKTLLVYSDRDDAVTLAVRKLAALVRDGRIGSVTVQTINGEPAAASHWAEQLRGAGFGATPQGLRLRSGIGSGAGYA